MNKKVVVIGGGVAGMQTALTLSELGLTPVIIEKEASTGGKLCKWHKLFPTLTPASEVLDGLRRRVSEAGIEVMTGRTVGRITDSGVELEDGTALACDATAVCTGFDIFDATLKEEYGYGMYDNVFTTVDLEEMFNRGEVRMVNGEKPRRVAFLHCVGSRDEKVNQRHCSRVCCITGVKQAMEVKQMIPDAEVFNFYMDMRMFGPGYEEMYRQAQYEYNIQFIRGRISEASQTIDRRVQIKAEDTLVGRPLKMTVDMLVLIVGMKAGASNERLGGCCGVDLYPSGFVRPADQFLRNVCSGSERVFYAGTVSAPKNVGESINEGIAAAYKISRYLNR
ncbi:MAG: CoB--CoM heterodisulfide reductase iron-sulfur subunit A family protein [Rikenellaceae bacterium]|nr:CoB--CoM heterodisulfide reductase iron-sulfur subunit A family protein [Rikenellaceae bacterium]